MFLRHGYSNANVDTIAAEAEVSKQTVYNHFRDKERLFCSVLQEAGAAAGFDLTLAEQLGDSADLDADLRRFARELIEAALDEDVAALRRLLIAEWDRVPEEVGRAWAGTGVALLQTLADAIRRQRQRGALDVPDPALAAHQLVLVTVTDAHTRALQGLRRLSAQEVEQVVDAGVDMWLRCYAPRGGA